MKRNKQKGFTIIELVVVILLLGILTATALPRFMDVTDDAHNAVVNAVEAGLRTGVGLYHAEWIASNQPTTVTGYGLENYQGYPTGKDNGVSTDAANSMTTSQECADVFNGLLQEGRPSIGLKAEAATALTTIFSNSPAAGSDFAAYLQDAAGERNECYYIYIGQYSSSSTGVVPVIKYDATTGAITRPTGL